MSSIRNLKKDINYVLGDIIETVYLWEAVSDNADVAKADAIIDEAIAVFDDLIAKVNNKSVENRKAHLKQVNKELEEKAAAIATKINALA